MYKYSKQTGGFYLPEIHGEDIPADAVAIPQAEYAALMVAQSEGANIQADENGFPVVVYPDPGNPAPVKIFSVREFRSRFAQQEQLDIRAASMTDHEVGLVYDEFLSAQYINLDDPAVEQGVDLYIAKGLIDPSRKSEILAPSMPE